MNARYARGSLQRNPAPSHLRHMNITELSTRQWPSVAVAVALVALFGLTSISSLPIQLLPNIEEPQITVANAWRAAAPEEMEANIVEPQESVLRNTPGLTDINSFVGRGQGFINLTFAIGTDMQTAKLDVINNLTQAPPRPGDASEPRVSAGGGPQAPGPRHCWCAFCPTTRIASSPTTNN